MLGYALVQSGIDLKAPSALIFVPYRSRPDLAEREATSGVSKVTTLFPIW